MKYNFLCLCLSDLFNDQVFYVIEIKLIMTQ